MYAPVITVLPWREDKELLAEGARTILVNHVTECLSAALDSAWDSWYSAVKKNSVYNDKEAAFPATAMAVARKARAPHHSRWAPAIFNYCSRLALRSDGVTICSLVRHNVPLPRAPDPQGPKRFKAVFPPRSAQENMRQLAFLAPLTSSPASEKESQCRDTST